MVRPETVEAAIDEQRDRDRGRTERQEEWAAWASHGYGKRYQPRSILRLGLIFYGFLVLLLLAIFWLAFSGHGLL